MQTQTINFTDYVECPANLKKNHYKIKHIDGKLKELDSCKFGIEQIPKTELVRKLKKQKAEYTYPKIFPEFLMMHNNGEFGMQIGTYLYRILKKEGIQIQVPKFGIYSLKDNEMKINFGFSSNFLGDYCLSYLVEKPNIPVKLQNKFAESSGLFKNLGKLFSEWNVERKVGKKWKRIGKLTLSSKLNALIPSEVKENIAKAKEVFDNQIWFIAETKPEEWALGEYKPEPKIVEDPLVIGHLSGDFYYIDKFNTTPMEDYVNREFTSGEL